MVYLATFVITQIIIYVYKSYGNAKYIYKKPLKNNENSIYIYKKSWKTLKTLNTYTTNYKKQWKRYIHIQKNMKNIENAKYIYQKALKVW